MVGETTNTNTWCLEVFDAKKNGQGGTVTGTFDYWEIQMNSIDTTFLPYTYIWDGSSGESTGNLRKS